MYYKVKITKKSIEVLGTVKRQGKQTGSIYYFTQDEIDKINPDALIGYVPAKNEDKIV